MVRATVAARSTPACAARTVSWAAARVRKASAAADCDFKAGALECGLRLRAGGRGEIDIGAAAAEIERLPTHHRTQRAAPYSAGIVGADHRTGDGGDHRLGQEQAEDVIAGGAVDLGERVHLGQVGGARQRDSSGGSGDLFLGDADGGIPVDRAAHGLGQGERLGRCGGGEEQEGEGRSGHLPSISSWKSSRTLVLAASSALRPRGVAR